MLPSTTTYLSQIIEDGKKLEAETGTCELIFEECSPTKDDFLNMNYVEDSLTSKTDSDSSREFSPIKHSPSQSEQMDDSQKRDSQSSQESSQTLHLQSSEEFQPGLFGFYIFYNNTYKDIHLLIFLSKSEIVKKFGYFYTNRINKHKN